MYSSKKIFETDNIFFIIGIFYFGIKNIDK